ncbi:MAG: retroviral-like aspartic protease, partial [Gammaproteobacteria bacterium]|nr:retroviral-like aspartic protease [Gammaproteobacteria bacterium]
MVSKTVLQCMFDHAEPGLHSETAQRISRPISEEVQADKELQANFLQLQETLSTDIPEFEVNLLVDTVNQDDVLLDRKPIPGTHGPSIREASRKCRYDYNVMRSGFVGLTEEPPELGDDPAMVEQGITYDICHVETHPEVPIAAIQAVAHAEDIIEEPDTETNDDLPVVMVVVDGEPGTMLADSGSQINGMSEEFYKKIARGNDSTLTVIDDEVVRIRAVGHSFTTKSAVVATVCIGKYTKVEMKFKILPGFPYSLVIGTPGLRDQKMWLTTNLRTLVTPKDFVPCLTQPQLERVRESLQKRTMVRWQVSCFKDVIVGPREEMKVEVEVKYCKQLGTVMFTPDSAFTPSTGMLLARSVHKLKGNKATLFCLNHSPLAVRIRRGVILGSFEPTDEAYVEKETHPVHTTFDDTLPLVPIEPKTRRKLQEYVRATRKKERAINQMLFQQVKQVVRDSPRKPGMEKGANDAVPSISQDSVEAVAHSSRLENSRYSSGSESSGEYELDLEPGQYPPIEPVEPDPDRIAPPLEATNLKQALSGCKLPKKWRRRLINLLWEFIDVFDGTHLGKCDI